MKIQGITLTKLNEVVLVFERNGITENGQKPDDIVFRLNPVDSYDTFLKLCPEPQPGKKVLPGGVVEMDTEAESYVKARAEWLTRQINFTLIMSLMGTPGLEWEIVDLEKPSTWEKVVEELQQCCYDGEIMALYQASTEVNNVTDASLNKARERFLAGERQRVKNLSSLISEQPSTESGAPANDSESSLPAAEPDGTTKDGATKDATSS